MIDDIQHEKLDEFDKQYKFILDLKLDTPEWYNKVKEYYFLHRVQQEPSNE